MSCWNQGPLYTRSSHQLIRC